MGVDIDYQDKNGCNPGMVPINNWCNGSGDKSGLISIELDPWSHRWYMIKSVSLASTPISSYHIHVPYMTSWHRRISYSPTIWLYMLITKAIIACNFFRCACNRPDSIFIKYCIGRFTWIKWCTYTCTPYPNPNPNPNPYHMTPIHWS